MQQQTVKHYLSKRSDNFLMLRILAASVVIYGHSFVLAIKDGSQDVFLKHNWGVYSGEIAVDIFFVVSGFMVSGSYMARSDLLDFTKARLLRIVPAYFSVLVLSAFVLGPVLSTISPSAYYAQPAVAEYVLKNLKFSSDMAWNLPGVFDGRQYSSINGSLWSLPAEMRMYVFVAALGVFGLLRPSRFSTLIVCALVILGIFKPSLFPLHPDWFRVAGFFCIGILFQLNKDEIAIKHSIFAVLVFLAYISVNTDGFVYLRSISIAYFCFWFAYRTVHWRWIERFGDPSYGIYLWGWPVQQTVQTIFPTAVPWQNVAVSVPIAIFMGYASWHLVEKQALKLKKFSTSEVRKNLVLRFNSLRGKQT